MRVAPSPWASRCAGPLAGGPALARGAHTATFDLQTGTDRVVTHLRIDERRGEPLTLEGKVKGALGLRPDQKTDSAAS